jgi:hypothetical protein
MAQSVDLALDRARAQIVDVARRACASDELADRTAQVPTHARDVALA